MPYYKFGPNDIFHNRIEAHPSCEFLIHDRKLYYNGRMPEPAKQESGRLVNHVPSGHLSLYELNVDRRESEHDGVIAPTMSYPFITKDGSATSFKTVSQTTFQSFGYGDVLTGSYPLSASLSVERYVDPTDEYYDVCGKNRPRLLALKNTLNHYATMSPHFLFGDKMTEDLSLISIPSIFYGSSIEKGTVSLKYYITGDLVGELSDINKNGELVQVGPEGNENNGKVAGIVLYNEGFVIITGSWSLDDTTEERYRYCPEPINAGREFDNPRWIYWGTQGFNDADGNSADPEWLDPTTNVISSSFYLSFNGTSYIPTLTMLAHAKKGELNHSNNPTYLTFGQKNARLYSEETKTYSENDKLEIANTTQSPYPDPEAIFEKQTWISKIGIYDKDKNLIAIAKLASPIRKTEEREFTFKLKMDF